MKSSNLMKSNAIKFSIIKKTFIVKPENGITKCKITYGINRKAFSNDFSYGVRTILEDLAFLPDYEGTYIFMNHDAFEVTGIAKCKPCDTFDEKIGKEVSCAIAEKKAYLYINKVFTRIAFLLSIVNDILANSISNNKAYINEKSNFISNV